MAAPLLGSAGAERWAGRGGGKGPSPRGRGGGAPVQPHLPPRSSAYDTRLRQKVAVKKLSRPFQSLVHARRTYRELRLLKHLKHENVSRDSLRGPSTQGGPGPHGHPDPSRQVIGLLDVFTPATSIEDFSEV